MGMDGTPNGEYAVRLNVFVAAFKIIDLHRQRYIHHVKAFPFMILPGHAERRRMKLLIHGADYGS